MSDSNDPKRPLVFDEDLAGTVFNTTDLNLKIEEQHRRNRERAQRSERPATANQSIEWVAQPNQSTTEPVTGASSSDSSKSASTSDLSKSANTSRKSGNKNALRHGGYFRGLLAWESQEEFEALRKGVREYWNPEGMFEEEVVLTLCQWIWRQ